MYHPHPSRRLNELFRAKPYQGVDPNLAKFLFVGLDANYDASIESDPIFSRVLEYHEDGAAFWLKHGAHHPFLLDAYNGSGRFYHKSFADIGFRPEHAELVSFIELMHVPTTGQSKLILKDLDHQHLLTLKSWIIDGEAAHIFFPAGVARLLKASKLFPWIPTNPIGKEGTLKVLLDQSGKRVYQHLHFSNYGKFLKKKRREAADIQRLLMMEAVAP